MAGQFVPSRAFSARSFAARGLLLALVCSLLVACREGAGPRPEEDLRVLLPGRPVGLDPHRQNDAISFTVLSNVYEGLTTYDADMRLVPALAESWETRDDTTWRIRLRRGVRFHDGSLVTAQAVVASLLRARDLTGSEVRGYLVAVKEVRPLDELTLDIVTDRPYATLLHKLAFVAILPEGQPEEVESPVGSGPFRWVGTEEDGTIRLRRFEDYWAGSARIGGMAFRPVADRGRRVDLLAEREADLATILSPAEVPRLEADPALRLEARSSLTVAYLALRTDVVPFDDRRVRLAIHFALDREALAQSVRGGLANPAYQMVSPYVFGYAPSVRPVHRDVDRARALLAEAGYPDGLELTIDAHESSQAAEPIREQLAEVGIRLQIRYHPWSEMLARLRGGDEEFFLGGFLCPSGDASDLLEGEVHRAEPERGFPGGDLRSDSNPALDELIERSSAEFNVPTRRQLLQEALQTLSEELAMIPLFVPTYLYGVREEIEWEPRLDGFVRGYEVGRVSRSVRDAT